MRKVGEQETKAKAQERIVEKIERIIDRRGELGDEWKWGRGIGSATHHWGGGRRNITDKVNSTDPISLTRGGGLSKSEENESKKETVKRLHGRNGGTEFSG